MSFAPSGPAMRKTVLGIAVVIATVLGVAESDAAGARPAQWTVVVSEKTGGADPLSEHGTNSQYYLIPHVVEPLTSVELQPDGSGWGVVPILAEKWRFPVPKRYVVDLRRGVRVQNGEDLTAEHGKS